MTAIEKAKEKANPKKSKNVYSLKDFKDKKHKTFDIIKFAQQKLIKENPNNEKYI